MQNRFGSMKRTHQQASALFAELLSASPFFLIAGPCVIESAQTTLHIASSYRGPGIERGLEVLRQVKQDVNIPVLTDVHEVWQVEKVAEVVDVIQIPAMLSRQTDLICAAAMSGRIVNVKKSQTMSAEAMLHAAQKIRSCDNQCVMLTERGSAFGYGDLIVDMRNLERMRAAHGLVVQDVTHSVQQPGGKGSCSGGLREFVPIIARAAAAVGVNGFFFETHPSPDEALSDGPNSWPLDQLEELVVELKEIASVTKGLRNSALP